jgi:hypothetical protein
MQVSNSTSSAQEKKFDVMQGVNFPFRIAQGLTRSAVDALCEERGYRVINTHAIGCLLSEVTVVRKAQGASA